MNIAFTGWSTGGHVFPIRSLIQYIKSTPEINAKFETIYRFGEKDSMEQRIFTELQQHYKNLQFETVIAGKVRREHDIRALLLNIIDLFRFVWWVIMMVVGLPHYHIDVVFCKGGFVSLPLTIAAYIHRIPIMVHESDTRAGLATRICGRLATHNFSGFPDTLPNSQVIGQIMGADLTTSWPYQYGDSSKTNLLITGWSLWAKTMYEAVIQLKGQRAKGKGQNQEAENPMTYDLWPMTSYNIIIILGALNANMKPQFEWRAHIIDFADQATMWSLYQRADICICRGGTTSLAEMEIFGIRKLIVPLLITHDQQTNAQYYVDHHGDNLIMQDGQITASLQQALEQYIWYHKKIIDIKNLSKKIDFAKEKIIDKLWIHQTPKTTSQHKIEAIYETWLSEKLDVK